jgi:ribonuclease P protein component
VAVAPLLMHVELRAVLDLPSNEKESFSSTQRLLRADGFDRAMNAQKISDKHFLVFFVKNNQSEARLGIVVAKKILALATARNFAKRKIRETFRQHSIRKAGLDIVVMIKPAFAHESVENRRPDLSRLLTQLELRWAE